MSETTYPTGYGKRLVTIDELFAEHHVDKMHPEYARRLRAWLIAQGGQVGIGGSWRDNGTQPDKPGFAPEGKSFHQYQRFASSLVAFCAVDLVVRDGANVHRAPKWSEVPAQGGAEAARWGVHCNISTETWHMQPVEIDGWASWISAGSPDPVTGYPIPGTTPPPDETTPTPEEDEMTVKTLWSRSDGSGPTYCIEDGVQISGAVRRAWKASDKITVIEVYNDAHDELEAALEHHAGQDDPTIVVDLPALPDGKLTWGG